MKSISLIKKLVEQELKEFGGGHAGGGIMDPNMVPFVPHREPAADPPTPSIEPTKEDKLYTLALVAREATEKLVKALDEPIYDTAYENAFKATQALRKALNALIATGAQPTPEQRVVAPPMDKQPWGTISHIGIPRASSRDNI